MIDLNITKIQIDYLLFIRNYKGSKTITEASIFFNCSRVNSKKILDRMIIIGVLYKENKEYELTKIGKDLADYYNENLQKNLFIVEKFLDLDSKVAEDLSIEILSKRFENFKEAIDKKYKLLSLSKTIKEREKIKDISSLLGNGVYEINFNIKKIDEIGEQSFMQDSMALFGFENNASIVIEEESYIEIYAKPIKKVNDGYYRKGIATKLFYFHDGEEFEINSKDRVFKIPLSIIDYWSTSDGVILESSLIFTIKSQIGMKVHEKKANFLFLVNLCLI